MRAFIAIELEETIKNKLSSLQEDLKNTLADIKLVKTDNIHLTLRFLGEIKEDTLASIKQILEDATAQTNSFEISLNSLGAFPSMNTIKVIWVGVSLGENILINLAQKINVLLEKKGFAKADREFSAHITLARVNSPLNKLKLQEFISKDSTFDLRQRIQKITLFKSTLTGKGPIYERLYEVNFKNI